MNRACFSAAVVLLSVCSPAFASGPQSRASTDPATVVSAQQSGASPVDIKDLLNTVRPGGGAWSPDGKQIVYHSNASGRINLRQLSAASSSSCSHPMERRRAKLPELDPAIEAVGAGTIGYCSTAVGASGSCTCN